MRNILTLNIQLLKLIKLRSRILQWGKKCFEYEEEKFDFYVLEPWKIGV
jgi:hypothetical protein